MVLPDAHPAPTDAALLELEDVRFSWAGAPPLLDIPSLSVARGERLFLKGPSGSGKSTLLGLVAGILEPDTGAICLGGTDIAALPGGKRDRLRADRLGVIFQMFNLVPYLPVIENAALPCRFSKRRRERAEAAGGVADEARRLLSRLGLSDESLLQRDVTALSVGQQQRVAAARALIGGPDLVIADEPTSALDHDARDRFIELLNEEITATGAGLIFVSHDATLAHHFDRAADLGALNRAATGMEAA